MSDKILSARALQTRLAKVKLFLCDVDGVLTDGGVYVSAGNETKRFHIPDGLGIVLLRREGIRVGWISNRPSPATQSRAEELKIDFLIQQKGNKAEFIEDILREADVGWADVCYVGDDIVDLCALRRAGLAVSVPNGNAEARQAARFVTRAAGGHGAIREVIEMILKAQKKWRRLIDQHSR